MAQLLPNFRMGTKKVYLPSHVITLLRTPNRPPQFAMFQVPLRFTKFDIRDYLWNLYNVEVKGVRSQVRLSPLAYRPLGKQVYRPASKKYMTVELVRPFIWPSIPENLEPWSKTLWDTRSEEWAKQSKEHMDTMSGNIPLAADALVGGLHPPKRGGRNPKRRGARRQKRDPKAAKEKLRDVPDERIALAQAAAALRIGEVQWKLGVGLDQKWGGDADYRTTKQKRVSEALKLKKSEMKAAEPAETILEQEVAPEPPKRTFFWKRNLLGRKS